MMQKTRFDIPFPLAALARNLKWAMLGMAAVALPAHAQDATGAEETTLQEVRVIGTAEEELKQAPGVSVITSEDIAKRPPANDLSEIIRTMPGVNLTGNSSSGAYGNNRQIDLRGMGPENTLIMIDGKPVSSRNSVRMGRNGERNTRGDSNWVPAEAVERIEVLRGPAAARYGSGAAGGVVNIITKRPADHLTGSVSLYTLIPEDANESDTKRASFHLAGPLSEKFSFRLYGNVNKTTSDSPKVNADAANVPVTDTTVPPAGREGVRNRDVNALLRWDLLKGHIIEFEGGFSRQGNIYAGDRLMGTGNEATATLASDGAETNTMYRRTGAITHRGDYGEGRTSRASFSYEGTTNSRLNEGMAGGSEGTIGSVDAQRSTSTLENYLLTGEYNTPLQIGGLTQVLTVGGEYTKQKLEDPYAVSPARPAGVPPTGPKADATLAALFVEDNIEITTHFILTPGLRYDHHDKFGSNWSPSLNASYNLTPTITLKGGIARAFKAPNLYQSNPGYIYTTSGNGCPYEDGNRVSGPCRIFGNDALDPEISLNKEIGIAWADRGWASGLTYFDNDYKNKIIADMGDQAIPPVVNGYRAFQWINSGKAIVRGVEGYLNIPILGNEGSILRLSNNLTWMDKNENRSTGQPLSVIPKYTVNSTLDWQATDKLSFQFIATFYGKQKPRTMNMANNTTMTGDALKERGSYELYGISGGYTFAKGTTLRVGINNLADKRLYREDNGTAQGAATYNEPGRSFFVNLTAAF
ncbi:MAG: FepA family TonB-dependent siderophore receptor [Zoogloeaceae bacterium]|jgi:ferric enterobactin receptor|nr:FepA family TonB-dependent siderophore receptor [Zoogloeaceae bacterium]